MLCLACHRADFGDFALLWLCIAAVERRWDLLLVGVVSYTTTEILRLKTYEPVLLLGQEKFSQVDIRVRVKGGGFTAQIYAIRQAIAKALVAYYQKVNVVLLLCTSVPSKKFALRSRMSRKL